MRLKFQDSSSDLLIILGVLVVRCDSGVVKVQVLVQVFVSWRMVRLQLEVQATIISYGLRLVATRVQYCMVGRHVER
jgi:hypothetical protein